ncbi:regulator of chromosome condensation 1/beta-lactamase-inhibitor protein II [Zychaea mexicana]|uniref:regulator of chromosome condensation 1/beta-lactamase-inhibitor protein II n=1 Tax=Zychaea mexicana TaxID=64656 RepID=UPI0022FE28A3|nr:regulator of chromosome condensation 1/beta-lactamase-inhibitor protein II [Zychaea mexicana]KAI9484406.1 regulator of chromosome condensation 1/beta-lactamase-inhibitor protein II [Zychaea mexicana]
MKLLDLPLEILIDNILYNLDAQSLERLSCANKTLRRLVDDELLWKHRVFADYNLPHDSSFRHSGWKRLYSKLQDSVVYTWGDNSDGRLGHPPPATPINIRFRNRDVYELIGQHGRRTMRQNYASPQELVALRGKGIVDILSGGWSFHALDRHGRVWLWGRMHGDMLARLSLGARLVSEPTQVQLPSSIQAISCGRSHTIALARDGDVWHWDNWQVVQRIRVAKPIVQVAANWGYSSLLTSQGEILRINHPESVTNEGDTLSDLEITESGVTLQSVEGNAKANSLPFKPIEKGDKIVQIAGLEKCTLALTRYGRVFKIHTENADELSVASASLTTELTKYGATQQELNERGPGKKMHRFVSGQFRNFAVYTAQGSVLLGHQDHPPEQDPEVLEQLQHDVCKVSFGDYHSGALTNQGRLLTWGANSNGAVGHGEAGMFVEPKETPEAISTLRNMFVFAIGFGGWQSGALAIPRD